MDIVNYFVVLGLIFSRFSGLFVLLPVFSAKNIPMRVKALFVFFISLAVMPIVAVSSNVEINSFIALIYHIAIEFLIGISFSMVVVIMLTSIYLAGSLFDRNIGFSMVSVISPMDQSSMPVSANLYYIFMMMIFLFTNGHHIVIQALVESFKMVPLAGGVINTLLVMDYTNLISEAFNIGIRLSAPFIITILVANIILGMLSKAMPGMNVFMIGMPFKIFIGLSLFIVIIHAYYNVFLEIYSVIYKYLFDLAKNFFGGINV